MNLEGNNVIQCHTPGQPRYCLLKGRNCCSSPGTDSAGSLDAAVMRSARKGPMKGAAWIQGNIPTTLLPGENFPPVLMSRS